MRSGGSCVSAMVGCRFRRRLKPSRRIGIASKRWGKRWVRCPRAESLLVHYAQRQPRCGAVRTGVARVHRKLLWDSLRGTGAYEWPLCGFVGTLHRMAQGVYCRWGADDRGSLRKPGSERATCTVCQRRFATCAASIIAVGRRISMLRRQPSQCPGRTK